MKAIYHQSLANQHLFLPQTLKPPRNPCKHWLKRTKLFSPQPLDTLQNHRSATYQATPYQLATSNQYHLINYPLAMLPTTYTQFSYIQCTYKLQPLDLVPGQIPTVALSRGWFVQSHGLIEHCMPCSRIALQPPTDHRIASWSRWGGADPPRPGVWWGWMGRRHIFGL